MPRNAARNSVRLRQGIDMAEPGQDVKATPAVQEPSCRIPWYLSWPVLVVALVVVYPLGLIGLIKRPSRRVGPKVAAGAATLPLFFIVVLLALHDKWQFGGGMTLRSFYLDWERGSAHDAALEEHRARSASAAPVPPNPAIAKLSWTDFRGPRRDGVVRDFTAISLDWTNDPPREIWRQPIGDGYAAFVLGEGRLYTIEQRRAREAITCYDATIGRELWIYDYPSFFKEDLGGNGPRATPTLDGGRLYALGAEGQLTCVSAADGRRIWTKNILSEFNAENLQWGMSASPLIVDDQVIVTNSGVGGGSIMAYRKADGERVWQTDVGQQGYSSPTIATLLGRRQVLNFAAFAVHGMEPETGKKLWSFEWKTDLGISCSQPIPIDDSRVFISLGYGVGSALVKLEPKNGDIAASEVWSNVRMKNKFTSSVLYEGHLYGLDEDILACISAENGERKWKGGRYGYGSVLLIGKHLLVSGEQGDLMLVEATPQELREIGKIRILPGKTWNNAAVAGGLLFARNHREMVCYDLKPKSALTLQTSR